MTDDEAYDAYLAEIDQPHGKQFAAVVGQLQEKFLRDRVTDDLEEAFRRAVAIALRLLPSLRNEAR